MLTVRVHLSWWVRVLILVGNIAMLGVWLYTRDRAQRVVVPFPCEAVCNV